MLPCKFIQYLRYHLHTLRRPAMENNINYILDVKSLNTNILIAQNLSQEVSTYWKDGCSQMELCMSKCSSSVRSEVNAFIRPKSRYNKITNYQIKP